MVLGTGIAVALGALMAGGDDPPFELYGMYGWKYKNGRPTPIRRKPDAGKERAYIHDHPTFGTEVVDHLKEHYKGAHYPACKSLVFIPTRAGEAHRDSVQGLIDASYLPPLTDDPCMTSFVKRAHEQGRVLPWKYLHYLRTLRATGYNVDLSQDFLDEHNRLLWNAELPDDAELANALSRAVDLMDGVVEPYECVASAELVESYEADKIREHELRMRQEEVRLETERQRLEVERQRTKQLRLQLEIMRLQMHQR